MYNNSLYHYGLPKRSGRYPYGSSGNTSKSKKREAKKEKSKASKKVSEMSDDELTSFIKRNGLEKKYESITAKSDSKLDKSKKIIDATNMSVNQLKKFNSSSKKVTTEKLDLSNMTDKEMRDKINRANLERQYTDMFAKKTVEVSKGQQRVEKTLEIGGAVLATTSSALGIALAIQQLRS